MIPKFNNCLRFVLEIPEPYRSIFSYPYFNKMQSEAMDKLLYTDENIVVSAPTGTGKTALMEMAMIHCFMKYQQDAIKIIYMAPTKSLCSERARDWKDKWKQIGIDCNEFTGDTSYISVDVIRNSHIIVTTPEKWDTMTRKWLDHRKLMGLIKLVLIDEVHILRELRGTTLEVCVSRMKTLEHKLRYVAISATLPNLQDISTWLNATALEFSEEYRTIPLTRYIYSYPYKGNMFAFEKNLDWKLLDIINKHSNNKPVLIFCSTRKSAQATCETLIKLMEKKKISSLSTIQKDNQECKDKKLSNFIKHGIGFHHAGLDIEDRQLVEYLFLNKYIRIVATTTTLAIGVNLPAHLVIIKSTKCYQNCRMIEYSDIDIFQMIGRAGRPGLDTSGCAVIMTTVDMENRYKLLISCQNTIESSLHQNLVEHLMSEIHIGTIIDIESGIKWLKSTFLYTRVKKNPSFYQIVGGTDSKEPDKILQDITIKYLKILADNNLVTVSKNTQSNNFYEATYYGEKMNNYYIKIDTMIKIMKHDAWKSIRDVLELVSQAQEFENNRFNANEKPFLKEINSNPSILYPLSNNKVSTVNERIFLLIQSVLSDISLYHSNLGSNLVIECYTILQTASRITKCIIECGVYEKNALKVKHSLELYSCLQAKMWTKSDSILKQVENIGAATIKNLAKSHIKTFEQLSNCDPGYLEMILHRKPPFGTKIKNSLAMIPQFHLDTKIIEDGSTHQPSIFISFSVTISLISKPDYKKLSKYKKGYYSVLWIETSSHKLIDFKRIPIHQFENTQKEYEYKVKADSADMNINCYIQSEDYVGLQVSKKLTPIINDALFISNSNAMEQHTIDLESEPDIQIKIEQDDNKDNNPAVIDVDNLICISAVSETIKNENPEEDEFEDTSVWVDIANSLSEVENQVKKKDSKKTSKVLSELCKHRCKNRHLCKHQCCKKGLNIINIKTALLGSKRTHENDVDAINSINKKKKAAIQQKFNDNEIQADSSSNEQLINSPKPTKQVSFSSSVNIDPWDIPDDQMLKLLLDMTSTNSTEFNDDKDKSHIPSTSASYTLPFIPASPVVELPSSSLSKYLNLPKKRKTINFKKDGIGTKIDDGDDPFLNSTVLQLNKNGYSSILSKYEEAQRSSPNGFGHPIDSVIDDRCDWVWEKIGNLLYTSFQMTSEDKILDKIIKNKNTDMTYIQHGNNNSEYKSTNSLLTSPPPPNSMKQWLSTHTI
ncbi:unnamed protein product [Cunninghamella blakesleeana]